MIGNPFPEASPTVILGGGRSWLQFLAFVRCHRDLRPRTPADLEGLFETDGFLVSDG